MNLFGKTFALVAVCLLLAGCGFGDNATLVPVTGTVKINGEPAADIMVMFVPKTEDESINAPTSQAITDASGNFDLFTTNNERGAIVGPHVVKLLDTTQERAPQGEEATDMSRLDDQFAKGSITVTVVADKPITLEATGPN